MEKSGRKSRRVHTHVSENVCNFQKMSEIGIAGTPKLVTMALRSDFVSAADEPRVVGGAIALQLVEKRVQASVQQALGAVAIELQRQIGRAGHLLMLRLMPSTGEPHQMTPKKTR